MDEFHIGNRRMCLLALLDAASDGPFPALWTQQRECLFYYAPFPDPQLRPSIVGNPIAFPSLFPGESLSETRVLLVFENTVEHVGIPGNDPRTEAHSMFVYSNRSPWRATVARIAYGNLHRDAIFLHRRCRLVHTRVGVHILL